MPAAGKAKTALGSVSSMRNVREGPLSVLPASSVARTWTTYWPSAGKLAAGKAYDQLPAAQRRREVGLGAGVEGVAVPVEAVRDALDADLDVGHAGAAVGLGPAEADRGAARVPAGRGVLTAGCREGEARARVGRVVREGAAGGGLGVADIVARAHADGVVAVGGEVCRVEVVRPVAGGEGRVVPDLGGAGEVRAVPVVAAALADGDLDLGDAGAGAVGVGAAEAGGRAAGVPARPRCSSPRQPGSSWSSWGQSCRRPR